MPLYGGHGLALVQFEIDQPGCAGASDRNGSRRSVAPLPPRGPQPCAPALRSLACAVISPRAGRSTLAGNLLTGSALRAEADARRAAGSMSPTSLPVTYGSFTELSATARSSATTILPLTRASLRRVFSPPPIAAAPASLPLLKRHQFFPQRTGVDVPLLPALSSRPGHFVLATGYELASIAPARGHKVISTWALATPPQPAHLGGTMRLSGRHPTPTSIFEPHDGRVICGGEDEDFIDEAARDA